MDIDNLTGNETAEEIEAYLESLGELEISDEVVVPAGTEKPGVQAAATVEQIKTGETEVTPTPGVTIEQTEVSNATGSATEEQPKGIATQDGKHVIPYAVLEAARAESRRNAESQQRASIERDNQIAHMPVSRMMDEIRGYGQMVGQLNQPERAAFLNNLVNPPDKTATREEAKGLRRDLLDVGKARAKALAGATDKEAMAAINSQYDQLQNQVLQTYGQPGKAADSFEDFAVEYQKENGVPPDPKNAQDTEFYQQWKSQKQGGTAPAAPATPTTATPQGQPQPPDNSYSAGYLREMRQQSQRQQQ